MSTPVISVFVLMPFDPELDSVFTDFIKSTFEDLDGVKFQVTRADDIRNQQSVLKDIILHIAQSDLVIADLTGNNPNVFYELGLAHALQRPVILLTQDIDEVPFDLRSYRILAYDTHFARIQSSIATLRDYARKFANREIQFGNPVQDFLPSGLTAASSIEPVPWSDSPQDERGFLDHVLDIVDGYTKLGQMANETTEAMISDVSEPTREATAQLERLATDGRPADPRAARAIARRLAGRISEFNAKLSGANKQYLEILQVTEHSLEFVAQFAIQHSQSDDEEVEEQFSSLRQLQSTLVSTLGSVSTLAESSKSIPSFERRLNAALSQLASEVNAFGSNIDRSLSSVTRALNIWDTRPRQNS